MPAPTPPRMLLVLSENWTLTGDRADLPTAVRWAREAEDTGFDAIMGVTLLTWVVYAGFLVLRWEAGWRGRRAAYLALVTGAPVVPLTFLGSREPGGHTDSLPPKGARIDIVVGQPIPVDAVPWPRRRATVAALTDDLHQRMLAGLKDALAETGRSLPGPLPPGDSA